MSDPQGEPPPGVEIRILVEPSLVEHFQEGLGPGADEALVREELTELVTLILDNSGYPLRARCGTADDRVHLCFRIRPFATPLF